MTQNGLVIFSKNIKTVAAFYQHVLNADITESAKGHVVLNAGEIEIVIHGIPKQVAANIDIETPPQLRGAAVFKPAFIVDSLEDVRAACEQYGGGIRPLEKAWQIRDCTVVDGWDPEGNIIQFKQAQS